MVLYGSILDAAVSVVVQRNTLCLVYSRTKTSGCALLLELTYLTPYHVMRLLFLFLESLFSYDPIPVQYLHLTVRLDTKQLLHDAYELRQH